MHPPSLDLWPKGTHLQSSWLASLGSWEALGSWLGSPEKQTISQLWQISKDRGRALLAPRLSSLPRQLGCQAWCWELYNEVSPDFILVETLSLRLMAMVLQLLHVSESPTGLVKTPRTVFLLQSEANSLGWGLTLSRTNKLPSDAHDTAPRSTVWEPPHCAEPCPGRPHEAHSTACMVFSILDGRGGVKIRFWVRFQLKVHS